MTRAQVLANAQASNAVIYTIALVDPMDTEADPGFLSQLSEATGGVAFRPKNIAASRRGAAARRARHPQHVHASATCRRTPSPGATGKTICGASRSTSDPRRDRRLAVRTRRAYLADATSEAMRDDATMRARTWLNRGLLAFGLVCLLVYRRGHGEHLAISARGESPRRSRWSPWSARPKCGNSCRMSPGCRTGEIDRPRRHSAPQALGGGCRR